jgi:excinuclease ABC subunit B
MRYTRNALLYQFVQILYSRTEVEFTRGSFRVKGDTVDVFPAYADYAIRLYFFGDEIESVHKIDPVSGKKLSDEPSGLALYPANLFVTGKETLNSAIKQIQDDMVQQHAYFEKEGRDSEAKRIMERTGFDLSDSGLSYCSGIELLALFDGRAWHRPFCLLDYFPSDYLLVVDESHATMPQIRAMWGGDRSRKTALIEYGFRLPSALDNRPLTFNEFESMYRQAVFVSATPSD